MVRREESQAVKLVNSSKTVAQLGMISGRTILTVLRKEVSSAPPSSSAMLRLERSPGLPQSQSSPVTVTQIVCL